MALSATAKASVGTGVDATSFSTGSYTPTASRLMLAFIGGYIAAGNAPTPTVSGNGLTWTLLTSPIVTSQEIWLFAAFSGAAPTATAVTASFGATTMTASWISVIEVSGAYMGATVFEAVPQTQYTFGGSGTSASVVLTNAPGPSSIVVAGFYNLANQALTPRTNWTELHDLSHTSPSGDGETQWSSTAPEQTASATWTGSSFWRALSAEITEGLLWRPPVMAAPCQAVQRAASW